jgi:hypothetical protein
MCSFDFNSRLAERGRLLNIAQIGTIDEAGSMTLPPARRSAVIREIRRGRRKRGFAHSTFWEVSARRNCVGNLFSPVRAITAFRIACCRASVHWAHCFHPLADSSAIDHPRRAIFQAGTFLHALAWMGCCGRVQSAFASQSWNTWYHGGIRWRYFLHRWCRQNETRNA